MNSVLVIAGNVFKESIRRKDVYVLAVLSLVIIGTSAVLNFWGAKGLEKFLKDISLFFIYLFSSVIAVLTAARQLPAETEARTLYPLLAKPVGRLQFLMGKFLGAFGIAAASLVLFTAEFLIVLLFVVKGSVGLLFFQALYVKCLELALITAGTLLLSTLVTHSACVTIALLFTFGWRYVSDSLNLVAEKAEGGAALVFKSLYFLVPHVEFLDWRSLAVHGWDPREAWIVAFLTVYTSLFIAAMMSLSWLRFRKRAL